MASVRVAFNQDIKSIEPDPARVDVWFLYWVLKAYESVILIPLPFLDDQRRIANVVGVQMAAVKRAWAAAEAQLEAAKALQAALLRRALSEEL